MRSLKTMLAALGAAILLIGAAAPAVVAGGIPSRPEKLKFPALKYDAPVAKDYRTTLDNGMVACMVPDLSLPLVNVTVLLRLGPDQDPAGKEGAGGMMMNLLTSAGTASLTAEQLEDKVAALGADLNSGMGGGRRGMMGMGGVRTGPADSWVSLNLLAKDLDEGLALLTDCLQHPAFQDDRLALAKERSIQRMKERNDSTTGIERREWNLLMDGPDHWSNRWTTEASISGLTRDDLEALHKQYVGPENFILAVSGNFDKGAMTAALEKAFAAWPWKAEHPGAPAAPTQEPTAGWYAVNKDVNQARVSFGLPAIDRYDPDWYAALVMNDILGGGGFSSRLVNRIRSDEGLAYSVRSSLAGGVYYPEDWRVAFQTKVRSTAYAIGIALTEINRMRDEKVSDDELALAKASFIESLPSGFETSGSIASALALEELTGRYAKDPEYFREYAGRINAVTVDDVQRVAQRLLDVDKLTFLIVGNMDEVMMGDPKHPDSVEGMAGGQPKVIPLRDPMTMKEMVAE